MRKSFWAVGGIAGLVPALFLSGCNSTPVATTGWVPADKAEMKNLIGNTVMQAIHQYQGHLQRAAKPMEPLKPSDLRSNFPKKPAV